MNRETLFLISVTIVWIIGLITIENILNFEWNTPNFVVLMVISASLQLFVCSIGLRVIGATADNNG